MVFRCPCLGFLLLLCLALVGAWSVRAGEIRHGMSREQVVAELGKPVSVVEKGGRVILYYPKGGRVELENDSVCVAKAVAVAPEEVRAPSAPTTTLPSVPAAREALGARGVAKQKSSMGPKVVYGEAGRFERLLTGREFVDLSPAQAERMFYLTMLTDFGVGTLVCVLALHLAFFWREIPHFWGHLFMAAILSSIAELGVEFAVYTLWGLSYTNFMNQILAYLVMVYALGRLARECGWGAAMAFALFARCMEMAVWFLGSAKILGLVFTQLGYGAE